MLPFLCLIIAVLLIPSGMLYFGEFASLLQSPQVFEKVKVHCSKIPKMVIADFEIIFHAFQCFRNYFPDIILFKNCRNSDGTTCILRAICTIRKGEEINDNYGFSYQIRPKEERQETLSQHYFFTCDCPACKQQWPLFHGKIQGRATTFVCSGCQRPLTPKEVEKLKKCPKCKKELKLGKVVRTLNK